MCSKRPGQGQAASWGCETQKNGLDDTERKETSNQARTTRWAAVVGTAIREMADSEKGHRSPEIVEPWDEGKEREKAQDKTPDKSPE